MKDSIPRLADLADLALPPAVLVEQYLRKTLAELRRHDAGPCGDAAYVAHLVLRAEALGLMLLERQQANAH
jgi:hypothetical protein